MRFKRELWWLVAGLVVAACGGDASSSQDAGPPTYTECIPGGFEILNPGTRDNASAVNDGPIFPLHVGTRVGISRSFERGDSAYGATYTVAGRTDLASGGSGYRVLFESPWGHPQPLPSGSSHVGPVPPFAEVYEETSAGVLLHASPFLGGELACPVMVAPAEIWPDMVWRTWTGSQVVTMTARSDIEDTTWGRLRYFDVTWDIEGATLHLRRYLEGNGLYLLRHSNYVNLGFESGVNVLEGDLPGLNTPGPSQVLSPVGAPIDVEAGLLRRIKARDEGAGLKVEFFVEHYADDTPISGNSDRCLEILAQDTSECFQSREHYEFFVGSIGVNPRTIFEFQAGEDMLALRMEDDETNGWQDFFLRWSNFGDRSFDREQDSRTGYIVPLRRTVVGGKLPVLVGTRNGVWAAAHILVPGQGSVPYELTQPGAPSLVPGNVSMRETDEGAELLITQPDGLIVKLDIDDAGELRLQRLTHATVPAGEVALGALRSGPVDAVEGSTLYVVTASQQSTRTVQGLLHPHQVYEQTLGAATLISEHPAPIAIATPLRDLAVCWPARLGGAREVRDSWNFVPSITGNRYVEGGSSPGRECIRVNMPMDAAPDRVATRAKGNLPSGVTIEIAQHDPARSAILAAASLPRSSGHSYLGRGWLADEAGLLYRALESFASNEPTAIDPTGAGHWQLLPNGFAFADDLEVTVVESPIPASGIIRSVTQLGALLYCETAGCQRITKNGDATAMPANVLFELADGTHCSANECVRPDASVVVLDRPINGNAVLHGNWIHVVSGPSRYSVHAFSGTALDNLTCVTSTSHDANGRLWVTYSEQCRVGALPTTPEQVARDIGLLIPGGVFPMGTYAYPHTESTSVPNVTVQSDLLSAKVTGETVAHAASIFGLRSDGTRDSVPIPENSTSFRVPLICPQHPDGCDLQAQIFPGLRCCVGTDLQTACYAQGCETCTQSGTDVVCAD